MTTLTPTERAGKLRALKIHALVFALVMIGLTALDWFNPGPFWVQWVWLGWGLGLAVHAGLVARRLRGTRA